MWVARLKAALRIVELESCGSKHRMRDSRVILDPRFRFHLEENLIAILHLYI